jgi:plastocyanin
MRAFLRAATVAAVLVMASACGGSSATAPAGGSGNTGGTGGNGGGGGSSNSIAVGDNFFNPGSTTVAVGTTVTWTFGTGTTHNVTFSDQGSGDKNSGSYSRTFNTAGTYAYSCTIHPGMNGTVVVQ